MKIKNLLLATALLGTLMSTTTATAFADESTDSNNQTVQSSQTKQNDELTFDVAPVIEEGMENQHYFDVQMKPGETRKIKVRIRNLTAEKQDIEIDRAVGWTNNQGSAIYMNPEQGKVPEEKSLKHKFTNISKCEGLITLEPNETRIFETEVSMPNEEMNGVIAGGLRFRETKMQGEDDIKQGGINALSRYQYVLAVILRQNRNYVQPNVNINSVKVTDDKKVSANLQNDTTGYVNQMGIKATITNASGKKVANLNTTGMQFVANSNFDLSFGEIKDLKAGKYKLEMDVYGNEDKDGKFKDIKIGEYTTSYKFHKHLTKDFTVTASQMKKIAKVDKEQVETTKPNYLPIILTVAALLISIAVFVYLVIQNRRRKAAEVIAKERAEKEASDKNDEK